MTLYRDATSISDRQFVIATWSSSYKNAHAAGIIASEDYPDAMHWSLGKLLDRPTTRALVAYEPESPDFLYGFIAGDTSGATGPLPIVFYVYVKEPYRSTLRLDGTRSGPRHCRNLFRALGVDPGEPFLYGCQTSIAIRLKHKIPRGKFVPATIRYDNYRQQEPLP